jgi:hypothetical protein
MNLQRNLSRIATLLLLTVSVCAATAAQPTIIASPQVTIGDSTGQRNATAAVLTSTQVNSLINSNVGSALSAYSPPATGARSWTSYFVGQYVPISAPYGIPPGVVLYGIYVDGNGVAYASSQYGFEPLVNGQLYGAAGYVPNGNASLYGTSSFLSALGLSMTVTPQGQNAFGSPPTAVTVYFQ